MCCFFGGKFRIILEAIPENTGIRRQLKVFRMHREAPLIIGIVFMTDSVGFCELPQNQNLTIV